MVLTPPSRSEPGLRAAITPRVQPMTMPRQAAIPARRRELAMAFLRSGQTGWLPLMLLAQSPVRKPPSHWK